MRDDQLTADTGSPAATESGELDGAVAELAELCVRVPVSAGAAGLARELSRLFPQRFFRRVLTRGGWYRLGGVVDGNGQRVADDLDVWAQAELARRDDDFHTLFDDFADSGLRATRFNGRTHYFVAATGSLAADFVQIEIEELQEVVSHELFGGEPAASIEELADASRTGNSKAYGLPLAAPFYALRRVTDVAALLRRIAAQKPEVQKVQRFFDTWQASSAALSTSLANHWVLGVREYVDQYHQTIQQCTPVAAIDGQPAKFDGAFGARGMALYEALQRFDRQTGYPLAWFFHMLTTKCVPFAVASAVVDDIQSGFSYLPERDVKLIKDWLHRPFSF